MYSDETIFLLVLELIEMLQFDVNFVFWVNNVQLEVKTDLKKVQKVIYRNATAWHNQNRK